MELRHRTEPGRTVFTAMDTPCGWVLYSWYALCLTVQITPLADSFDGVRVKRGGGEMRTGQYTSSIEILERFQSKALRMIVDAPWYVPNTVIRRDLQQLKKKSAATALNTALA
jgi:hypothetical protein